MRGARAALLLLLTACEGGEIISRDAGSPACDVPALFARSCFGGCHEAAVNQAGLDLETPGVAGRLYNHPAAGRRDYLLIDPEISEESALIEKMRVPPPFGSIMPLRRPELSEGELTCVQSWVTAIARGGQPDASVFSADGGGARSDGGQANASDGGAPDAGRSWGPFVDSSECVPDGGAWCIVKHVAEPLYAVRGISDSNIWAVGARGAAYHFDGTAWSRSNTGTTATLFDVFQVSASEVWAVGQGGLVLRNEGASWREVAWAPNAEFPDAGLSATGKPQWDLGGVSIEGSDVWVAGSGKTLAHFENGVMRVQTTTHPNEPGADLLRVWHRSANEWWAVGEAYLQRDAPAAGDWVVGRGAILRAFGLAGSENPATGEPVLAIVGADGWLYKYDYTDPGTYPWQPPNYRPARLELRRDLRAIWLDGAAKGWAVGLDGQIISVDLENFAYARFETPTRDHLLGLWGTSVRKTWVVGGRSEGVILRSR